MDKNLIREMMLLGTTIDMAGFSYERSHVQNEQRTLDNINMRRTAGAKAFKSRKKASKIAKVSRRKNRQEIENNG